MSVGLAKNPATFFNWQLTVANGCLNKAARPGRILPAILPGASISGIAFAGLSRRKGENNREIVKAVACHLAPA